MTPTLLALQPTPVSDDWRVSLLVAAIILAVLVAGIAGFRWARARAKAKRERAAWEREAAADRERTGTDPRSRKILGDR